MTAAEALKAVDEINEIFQPQIKAHDPSPDACLIQASIEGDELWLTDGHYHESSDFETTILEGLTAETLRDWMREWYEGFYRSDCDEAGNEIESNFKLVG